jgi:hypothetical protein
MPPDDPSPPDPSLFREILNGTASLASRFIIAFATGVFYTGAALLLCYLLAASVRSFDRRSDYPNTYLPGAYPRDELIATVCGIAALLWIATIFWLFLPRARRRPLGVPIIQTAAIAVAALLLACLAGATLHGDWELVVVGIILLALAAIVLLWLHAIRRARRGRPFTNRADQLPDIRCPQCGYRMVGLHEARCPECGQQYTLDDLLARQNFQRPAAAPPPPPPPPATQTPPPLPATPVPNL